MDYFIKGVTVGVILTFSAMIVVDMISPPDRLTVGGEPLSISDMGGEIVVVERLSPRNLVIVKIGSGEKIVSDLPIGLEKGDIFIVDKNGKVSKLTEVKK